MSGSGGGGSNNGIWARLTLLVIPSSSKPTSATTTTTTVNMAAQPLVVEPVIHPALTGDVALAARVVSVYFDWCNCGECQKVAKQPVASGDPEGRYFATYTHCDEHGWLSCPKLVAMRDLNAGRRAVRIACGASCLLLQAKRAGGMLKDCDACVARSYREAFNDDDDSTLMATD